MQFHVRAGELQSNVTVSRTTRAKTFRQDAADFRSAAEFSGAKLIRGNPIHPNGKFLYARTGHESFAMLAIEPKRAC